MAIDLTPDLKRGRINLRISGFANASECFEYTGERWQIRFQSWIRESHEPSPLLVVSDHFPDEDLSESIAEDQSRLGTLLRRMQREGVERQLERGWHLRWHQNTIEGWFDLDRLPSEGQKNAFASFDLTDGETYRCQLFAVRKPIPSERPVEREWRRGASAGLPTLGKRR